MTVGPVRRDTETAPFFEAAARGRFLLRRCPGCGAASEPQAKYCPACGSADLAWEAASGEASIVSWSVLPGQAAGDGGRERTVLVIAVLAEGPWWWSRLADADPAALRVGQPLRIGFERSGEHEPVPVFRLA
jgi:hypothetical protein